MPSDQTPARSARPHRSAAPDPSSPAGPSPAPPPPLPRPEEPGRGHRTPDTHGGDFFFLGGGRWEWRGMRSLPAALLSAPLRSGVRPRHARNARSRGGAAHRRGRHDIMRKWRPRQRAGAAGRGAPGRERQKEGGRKEGGREGRKEAPSEAPGGESGGSGRVPHPASRTPHPRTGGSGSTERTPGLRCGHDGREGGTTSRSRAGAGPPGAATGASGGGPGGGSGAAARAVPFVCRRDRASPGRDLPVPPGNSPEPPLAPPPPLPAAAPPRGGSPGPGPAPPAAGTARPPRSPRPRRAAFMNEPPAACSHRGKGTSEGPLRPAGTGRMARSGCRARGRSRVPGQRGRGEMFGSKELARSEGMRAAAPRAWSASPKQLLSGKVLGVRGW